MSVVASRKGELDGFRTATVYVIVEDLFLCFKKRNPGSPSEQGTENGFGFVWWRKEKKAHFSEN